MDERNTQLDEALSALTEAVIGGKTPPMTTTTKEYEQIIRTVNTLTSSTPSPDFHSRLTARLNQEWDVIQRENRTRQPSRPWYRRTRTRWIAVAAALLILSVAAILWVPANGTVSIPGLAFGNADVPTLIIGVLIAGAIVVGLMGRRRK